MTRTRSDAKRGAAHARSQLLIAAVPGLAAGILVSLPLPWQGAALVGWDVAAAIFLVRIWTSLWGLDARNVARVATREDPSRSVTDVLLILASLTCIVGVGFTLIHAARSKGVEVAAFLGLAVVSLVASWLIVHTVFTLRYARLYYAGTAGGISFNEEDQPVYSDFAYVAFTIGMTFQVSDTNIEDKLIRRTALRHALISYLFGAVLVAMTVNVGASLLK
ncbi:MAG TPA: DUF1345 domain-containing protein [Acidimicrobiales bacterium]|nr:DUF1345 domain-containing protein [Acidimicrobiales bacterium]